MITAIVGANWGDEGKGRMVDLLSQDYEIVMRYQGGNNAGHTVINDKGKFILNLLPSGILREEVVNVMGGGMVIDIKHLTGELNNLRKAGIVITPNNLKISSTATICMPYNVMQDILEEERLKDKKFGSTRRGIAPIYADKYMKKTIRMGDLFNLATLEEKVAGIVEWKNLTIEKGYGSKPFTTKEIMEYLTTFGLPLLPYICNVTEFLSKAIDDKKDIMMEAQLGALRDIDFGIYPYTSSSSTIASYAPIGAGIPFAKIEKSIAIVKAYSSCVGEGPFTVEMFGQEAEDLRKAGGEYGAATGRPRRVGAFDVVATKYGVKMQGGTEVALTKLDVMSYMKKIPICVAYDVNGTRTDVFPTGDDLVVAKPIIEYMDGFETDISGCKKFKQLPIQAQNYIKYVEKAIGCRISYVSVGADRDAFIKM
ncbi:MAG: adenylosuccinate synthase [Clostridia bacterium]